MLRYCILDGEMGGRDLKYSLLQSSFIISDENFHVLSTLHLNLKPDDGIYILNADAMNINKIDIVKHDKIAIPYKTAKGILYNFLKTNTNNCQLKLVPVGHAINGDIDFITKYLLSEGTWHQFCTYHVIDTSIILQFLRACGKMPFDCDGSLSALAKYFKINQDADDEKFHTSMFDAEVTGKIYQKMIDLVKC